MVVDDSSKNLFDSGKNSLSVFSPNYDPAKVEKMETQLSGKEGREGGEGERGNISTITWEEEREGEEKKKESRTVRFQQTASDPIPVPKKVKLHCVGKLIMVNENLSC